MEFVNDGRCWRCKQERNLVHDPWMPPADGIGVCVECAVVRAHLRNPQRDQRNCR